MIDPTPADLTLEELGQLKTTVAMEISAILNRFSLQTGLDVVAVELDRFDKVGAPCRYAIHLDVRL